MRLDVFLVNSGIFPSRNKSAFAINNGKVLYKGKPCKPSLDVSSLENIDVLSGTMPFVSNGGFKLEKALNDFDFNVKDMTFADIGASNGGFVDCLLQRGVKKVFAIDVGDSQLDKSLICDKVFVLDNFNARNLSAEHLGGQVDGVTCDVSFISLKLILPSVKRVLKDGGVGFLLVKPQFECGRQYLSSSGIVKSALARKEACLSIYNCAKELGLTPVGFTVAPLRNKKNIEYILMIKNDNVAELGVLNVINAISASAQGDL